MRKLTRQLILLVAVFVVYFGYSAWIDSLALYKLAGIYVTTNGGQPVLASGDVLIQAILTLQTKMGTLGVGATSVNVGVMITNINRWLIENKSSADLSALTFTSDGTTYNISELQVTGVMAQDSLLYAVLAPFKLVLVGGVFGLLVPLTKQVFFGTVVGVKQYINARRNNVLFNYQKTIAYVSSLNSNLQLGDYEQIKASYAGYTGLVFKPKFLDVMMDDIANSLIREQDMSVYVKPSEVVLKSVKQMYERERKLAISMRPDEMFFDLKRGYEATSIGSKYVIAYYKTLDTNANGKNKLGWKLFSLEMFKAIIAMIAAIVPTVIVAVIVLPILAKNGVGAGKATPGIIFGSLMLFTIIFHAISVFSKTQYHLNWKTLVLPSLTYYLLLALAAFSFVVGLNAVINLGSIVAPNTSTTKMWPWFSAVANLVLTTSLMFYVVATLMDGNVSPLGLTNKLFVDGVVLPIIAWVLGVCFNLYGNFANNGAHAGTYNGIAFGITLGFWIYLSISSVLLNNIVIPSHKRRVALKAELAHEGQEALDKRAQADGGKTKKADEKTKEKKDQDGK